LEVANTLAYYNTATITAVKRFIEQTPGGKKLEPIIENDCTLQSIKKYGVYDDLSCNNKLARLLMKDTYLLV
jgi:hypothetical protein